MSKQKSEWLCRELLTSPYCYTLCLTEKAFHAELKSLKVSKRIWPEFLKSASAHATVHFFEKRAGFEKCAIVTMRTRKGKSLEQTYAMLVHEAVHIWQACKDDLGIVRAEAEQEAYAIQRIAQSLMYSYRYQTRKRRLKNG